MGDVAFDALAEPPALRVADTVGNEQYTIHLAEPVAPVPAPTDGFRYPVSDAVEVEMSGFELDGLVRMHLWDGDGDLVDVARDGTVFEVPAGDYSIELCRPLKTYLDLTASISFDLAGDRTRVGFDRPASVTVGARSPRRQPPATVTTSDDPRDLLRAVSYLGEGLATTTPMRAFPNLRGYPPDIRLGDRFDAPSDLDPGPQPVTLVLPPELPYIYEAAPLAYYLNADTRAGSQPVLAVDGEAVYEFDTEAFADDAERVLTHVFVLDSVVRSAGPYPLDPVERDALSDVLPEDLSGLFETGEADRLRRYLDVPFDPVTEQAPAWRRRGFVEPDVENVEAIPHLAAGLVPVRTSRGTRLSGAEARRAALRAFTDSGSLTRAASRVFDGEASFVDSGDETTAGDLWVGDDVPIVANKFLVEGYRNRLDRTTGGRRSVGVTIVCNERWMDGEVTSVESHYGARDDLPFDVTVHRDLDCDALATVLRSETDFLHYVGHATAEGIECSDGYLDVGSVASVGVETFLLNACQSYEQGMKLVQGGAIGGIATLSDVTDDQAAAVGRTVARLLNIGYPLRMALELARTRSVVGGQYLAIGDDNVSLVPADSFPHRGVVTTTDGGYELTVETYTTSRFTPGGAFAPGPGVGSRQHLVGKRIGPYELSTAEFLEFLADEDIPVEYDGEFRWASDLADELG